jgi:pyruvate/2-oxoacid:ferredoxin oxidoreductase alpha subunit
LKNAKSHFWSGNEACAEGALVAGCRFFAGYPISPSNEIPELLSERLPLADGIFMQMEDELASIGAVMGASWAGKKAMTATSGPSFSLMQETISWGFMTDTPCVVVACRELDRALDRRQNALKETYSRRVGEHTETMQPSRFRRIQLKKCLNSL